MPEGHVIHRMAASYERAFLGTITHSRSPQGRFAAGAAAVDGLEMTAAEAIGKHFFAHFGPTTVHVHLGMAGRTTLHREAESAEPAIDADGPVTESLGENVTVTTDNASTPPDEATRPVIGVVRWRLENESAWADLVGPAVCEVLAPDELTRVLARLGPDPLRADADPGRAWEAVRRSRQPIALLLMDQKIFAGVGNIFRAEVLYRAGLDPMLPGVALQRREFDALWADLVELMSYAVRTGRIDTVRPEHTPEAMGRPPREDAHGGEVYVYRRAEQACLVCSEQVRTSVIGARNLFWCPRCQPLSRRKAAVEARKLAKLKATARLG